MRAVRNKWPQRPYSRNVLFVAQSLREMLGASTYESFRVSTLDVKSRIRELIDLVREVMRERVPIVSLDPCLDELLLALENNQVTRGALANEIALLRSRWGNGARSEKNIKLLRSFLVSIHRKLSRSYKAELEGCIISAAQKENSREECRTLVNAYSSMLINDGYIREFVLQEVESRFFSNEIRKVEKRTLQRFFSRFDGEEHWFTVYLPISKHLASYLSKLNIERTAVVTIDDLPADASVALMGRANYDGSHRYLQLDGQALDPFGALKGATELLSSLVAMTYVGRRGVDFQWYAQGYVKRRRANAGRLIALDEAALQTRSSTITKKIIQQLKGQTEQILGEFTAESTERLLSAINISALSRASPRPENQLITLWSAIEVLLSDPPRGVPRVVHYVDTLTPCICLKYVRRQLIAVLNELRVSYPKHIRDFFRRPEFNPGLDPYTNFTKLLYCDHLKILHADFTRPLGNNPLALYRLWKLEDNFGNRENLRRALTNHEQRVRWQLYRIYRTRNNIVHSGRIPSFLTPLVLNVYEYFQDATGPILGRASAVPHKSAIDQIVAEIGFDYQMMISDLHAGEPLTPFREDELREFHR